MAVEAVIDSAKTEAFVGKVFGDLAGVTNTAMASIGDQLGLFKNLAEQGPATSTVLAERTGDKRALHSRVARCDGQR